MLKLLKITGLVTAVTVLGSAALVAMLTPAAAFDLNGLVQGAIAQYVAGGSRPPNLGGFGGTHYAGVNVASRRSQHDDDGDEDATPGSTNTPPARQITDTPPHFSAGGSGMVTNARSEEPAFAPSR